MLQLTVYTFVVLLGCSFASIAAAETRNFVWIISETTDAPDGVSRSVLAVNGQPGYKTVLDVNVGDTVRINVTNMLTDTPTAIHFHGILQQNTPDMDGPVGISQCPIAPGQSYVYEFHIQSQSGTYWWHSHFKGQYMDGLRGPFIIRDPSMDKHINCDDERIVQLSDWYHDPMDDLLPQYLNSTLNPNGNEPVFQSGLINGRGQFNCSATTMPCNPNQPPAIFHVKDKGKKTRLRLINTSGFAAYLFSIDHHKLKVMEVDGTLVEPFVVDTLTINVAQRYSVLIESPTVGHEQIDKFWMRAKMYHMSPWTSGPDPMGFNETVLAVWSYDDGKIDATDFPTTNDAPVQGVSVELNDLDLRPKIRQPAPQLTDSSFNQYFTFDFETRPGDAYQKAYVTLSSVTNASAPVSLNSTYSMPMQSPLLFDVINDNATAIASSPANVVHIKDDEIVQLIYINRDPGEHPFHYHGHFFFVLAKGTASNLSDIPTTFNNTDNPLRRDTFTVPPCDTDPKTGSCANFGYTVVRFKADNPGVWLLHCHIEWHMADGLAITIIEGAEEIRKAGLSNPSQASETCKSYNVWSSANPSLGMMMMDGRLKEDQMTRILKSSAKLTTRPAISLVMAALMVMMAIII